MLRRSLLIARRPAASALSRHAARLGAVGARHMASRTALIKELRARTAAPMKKCAEALDSANGDIDEAVALLRKSGSAAAAKKQGRESSEGAVSIAHGPSGVAFVELNSETDFVARNELFQSLAADVARTALGLPAPAPAADGVAPLDVAAISGASLDAGSGSVTEAVGFAVAQLGENLVLRRACLLPTPAEGGTVAAYVHNTYAAGTGRTAAAVALRSAAADSEALRALGEKLAMHIVAASPTYLDRASVPEAAVASERDILVEQAKGEGKPAKVVEKMVEGRLNKFYADVCLLEQQYMIEQDAGSVAKVLADAGEKFGADVSLAGFVRYHVGEGQAAEEPSESA